MIKLLLLLFITLPAFAQGKITFYTGPMFASKTSHLISKYLQYKKLGYDIAAFKPSSDTRYSMSNIVSHNGIYIAAINFDQPLLIISLCSTYEILFFDEIQFVHPSIVSVLQDLRTAGKKIYISGLDLDYRRNPWPVSSAVKDIADKVVNLTALCSRIKANKQACNLIAHYTQRLSDGIPAPLDQGIIQLGSSDSYQPRCLACWLSERQ